MFPIGGAPDKAQAIDTRSEQTWACPRSTYAGNRLLYLPSGKLTSLPYVQVGCLRHGLLTKIRYQTYPTPPGVARSGRGGAPHVPQEGLVLSWNAPMRCKRTSAAVSSVLSLPVGLAAGRASQGGGVEPCLGRSYNSFKGTV